MKFKNQQWVPYGKQAKYLNIGVKNNFKQTIESFELEKGKEIDKQRIIRKLKEYGFDLTETKKINEIKKEEKESWLKKNMEW